MKQRTTEWIEQVDSKYHTRQFDETYRSTVSCCRWMEELGYIDADSRLRILDIGSGQGANIHYMARKYPDCDFVGIDVNSDLMDKGNRFFKENKIENCRLETGDIYNLNPDFISAFDGILCWQVLSWLPEYQQALKNITELKAKWISLMSLFDSEVSCTIQINDYSTSLKRDRSSRQSFHNIYYLKEVEELVSKEGYSQFKHIPFEIDIDLPRGDKKGLGSYTRRFEDGNRLQMSGPLLMPWHFVLAAKS